MSPKARIALMPLCIDALCNRAVEAAVHSHSLVNVGIDGGVSSDEYSCSFGRAVSQFCLVMDL